MRILIAAETLGGIGGTERLLEILLEALPAMGHEIATLSRAAPDRGRAVAGRHVVAWSDEHDPPSQRAGFAAARLLREFQPDLVMAHNVMDAAVLEALRAAPRLTYFVHDHRPFCPNGDRMFPRSRENCTLPLGSSCAAQALLNGCGYGPRPRTLSLIRRRVRLRDAIAACDRVVFDSHYTAERGAQSGVPRERSAVIGLPLPTEAFANPAKPAPTREVLFVGRVVPQKGLVSLVRAIGSIPVSQRPPLRVLGDGPALAEARAAADARSVALREFGVVGPAAVRAALDETALLAFPSLWAEPYGYVGLEAFARARPVVGYNHGGARDWLFDGINGTAVAPRDESALAEAIAYLLVHDDLRERLGAQAFEGTANAHRAELILPRYLE